MSRWRSFVERRHWWKRSKASEIKEETATAAAAPAAAESYTDMVTTADLAAVKTGHDRRDTTVETRNERDSQWQN